MTNPSDTAVCFVSGKPTRITRTCTGRGLAAMQALLSAGELEVGDLMTWRERGRTHRAIVQPDGRLLVHGQLAGSPSRAGRIAHGSRRPNGWEVWTCVRDGETLETKRRRIGLDPR
jgi:hypothetical protein